MSRLVGRLFPRVSDRPRPASGVRRATNRRVPLLPQALEGRIAPANFVVTSLGDQGDGTLRAALTNANQNPGPDTISFQVSGTINWGSLPLWLSSPIAINGNNQIRLHGGEAPFRPHSGS